MLLLLLVPSNLHQCTEWQRTECAKVSIRFVKSFYSLKNSHTQTMIVKKKKRQHKVCCCIPSGELVAMATKFGGSNPHQSNFKEKKKTFGILPVCANHKLNLPPPILHTHVQRCHRMTEHETFYKGWYSQTAVASNIYICIYVTHIRYRHTSVDGL